MLTKWFSNAILEYNSKSVVYSGGISMNVKANLVISKIPQMEIIRTLKNIFLLIFYKYIKIKKK